MDNIKAVLFDLDGTLIDSEWFYYKAYRSTLRLYGRELKSEDWLKEFAGKTDGQTFGLLQDKYGVRDEKEVFFDKVREFIKIQHEEEAVPLMPGATDLIHYLWDQQVVMAVVTSSKREVANYHLDKNGVRHFFSALISRTEVQNPKPHPEPYQMCMEKLNVAPQHCLALEDSPTGSASARSAGLTTFGINTHESIRKSLDADRVFDNLHEVREFLENW
ncbi:HAD family phosphatase [Litoribacter alkaliphilus]|uniref:HAD family phosphatase n=2 Tax=Litoribacter ruber TaxID=702568 RepID=A0AAP2CKL3_9BACT|nr:HAD family phosphatase [Litoribacter alkaliphilus]